MVQCTADLLLWSGDPRAMLVCQVQPGLLRLMHMASTHAQAIGQCCWAQCRLEVRVAWALFAVPVLKAHCTDASRGLSKTRWCHS